MLTHAVPFYSDGTSKLGWGQIKSRLTSPRDHFSVTVKIKDGLLHYNPDGVGAALFKTVFSELNLKNGKEPAMKRAWRRGCSQNPAWGQRLCEE